MRRTLHKGGHAGGIVTAIATVFVALAGTSSAQEGSVTRASHPIGGVAIDTLPGVERVKTAGPLAPGLGFGVGLLYGFTEDILQESDAHHRAGGTLAASFGVSDKIAFGVRLDARYDSHSSDVSGDDSGSTVEGRGLFRAAHAVSPILSLGSEVAIWVPGGVAGTSGEVRGILSLSSQGFGFDVNAGFRLDRSAESVDNADMLSRADRLALGVSDFNAVLGGLALSYRLGALDLIAETSVDLLIGDGAPDAIESPIRIGAGIRYQLPGNRQLTVMAEGVFGRAPFIDAMQPLVPVDPLVALRVGISQRPSTAPRAITGYIATDGGNGEEPVIKPGTFKPVEATRGALQGRVVDTAGQGIPGASVRLGDRSQLTDSKGRFKIDDLEPGDVTVKVDADSYDATESSAVVVKGETTSINIVVKLKRSGTVRGNVQSFSGQPLEADIVIEPGGYKVKSRADGRYAIDLPAGKYKATFTAPGHKPHTRPAEVNENAVTIIVVDLQKQ